MVIYLIYLSEVCKHFHLCQWYVPPSTFGRGTGGRRLGEGKDYIVDDVGVTVKLRTGVRFAVGLHGARARQMCHDIDIRRLFGAPSVILR